MDVPRRLEHRYQVRFDEADAHGRLRPSGYLRFAQDAAWRHSELAGFGREWYEERALMWLVRDVRLSITGATTYADVLAVSTEVVGWRHVWARRHSELRRVDTAAVQGGGNEDRREAETLIATVDTDWVLLAEDGRPARVPDEITSLFGPERTFERRREALPATPPDALRLTARVRPLDVDPMGHMNNAAYLDVVDEALAQLPHGHPWSQDASEAERPTDHVQACRTHIGYVRPALPGSLLDVACWQPEAGKLACRICNEDREELARIVVRTSASQG